MGDLGVDRSCIAREPLDDTRADGRHAGQAGRVDLVGGIARLVIVAVTARVEEEDRDPGRIELAVVGWSIGRAVDVEGDALELRRVAHEHAEPVAAVAPAHVERSPLQPADHVEVHHRDRAIERDGGPVHVVTRADQPELLGAEEREDQGAARAPGGGEGARQAEDHGGSGSVVVGTRVDDAVGAAEVVVVRADDDGFGGERRVVAGQDADDVRGSDLVDHLLDAEVRAGSRRERRRSARRRQRGGRVDGRSSRRSQERVGGRARHGARHQPDLDRSLLRRRKLAARDQQRSGAAPLRCNQLVEAAHPRVGQISGRPVERERDLSANVDTGVVVVLGFRNLRAVADEHDVAADLAGS